MGREGRIPLFGPDPPMRDVAQESRYVSFRSLAIGQPSVDAHEGWECADCGWSVHDGNTQPGWTVAESRLAHIDKYCALPAVWPPPK